MASLLSEQEWEVYSHLSEAWNKFIKLELLHPNDNPEFAFYINGAKNILMSRPVERELKLQGSEPYQLDEDSDGV